MYRRSGYQKDIKELRRHQNILGLIRQITEQEMTDPVQHFRDDLNDAAKYLIKQMPEIADWIKDKLEQHPQLGNGNGVVQRVEQVNRQHHPTLRPPPPTQ